MKKCLIVYFTQGGTTSKVADRIASGLTAAEFQVDVFKMGDSRCPDPREYDMLGIGFPVYYYRPPFNVMDYVRQLPDLNGLPTFVFALYGTYYGDAFPIIRGMLKNKGSIHAGDFACHGNDLFFGYLKQGYLFSPHAPYAEELDDAENFGKECATFFVDASSVRVVEYRPLGYIYRLERLILTRWLVTNLYSRTFKANKKCTQCGICSNQCPTQNISLKENSRPKFGRNCVLCLYCQLNCPQGAIKCSSNWPVYTPFMIYNTRSAAKDPKLQHVSVQHKHGVIKEL